MAVYLGFMLCAAGLLAGGAGPGWFEVVSLDRLQEPPHVLPALEDGRSPPVPVSLAGWAVVCAGGDPGGIACAKRRLSAGERLSASASAGRFVVGRVLAGREAVAGARVAVFLAGLEARRAHIVPLGYGSGARRELVHEVATDPGGRFELPTLGEGEYRVRVTAPWGQSMATPDFAIEVESERAPPKRHPLDLGDLVLAPGAEVAIEVIDRQGQPLAGARVVVSQPTTSGAGFSGVTDEAGRAVFRGLDPAAGISVRCRAVGHTPVRLSFPSPQNVIGCTLDPFSSLTGRVVADGEPLSGAAVTLTGGPVDETGRRVSRSVGSDTDGGFSFRSLEPGGYRVVAAAPGYEPVDVELELVAGEAREVELPELLPGSWRSGVVVAAVGGGPIAAARVLSREPPGAVDATTDDDGRFDWTAREEAPLVLEVSAEGFATEWLRVPEAAASGDEPLVVRLERPGRIAVVARGAAGEPCGGCDFAAGLPARPGLPETPVHRLRTDATGRAESPPLPPGDYFVTREVARSFGDGVTVRSGDDTRHVRVQPGVLTEVRFDLGSAVVRVRPWPPLETGWRLAATARSGRRVYDRDPRSGDYLVDRRPGEPLSLELVATGATVTVARLPHDFEETVLDLAIPRTAVTARLVAEVGRVVGREVRALGVASGASLAWRVVGADGRFDLVHLPAGTYALTVDERFVTHFTVGEGDRLDLGDLQVDDSAGGS